MAGWTLEWAVALAGALVLLSPLLAIASYLRLRRLERRLVLLEARLQDAAPVAAAPVAAEPEEGEEPAPAPASVPPASPLPAKESLEKRLAERWLVWLGGVALALGGLFVARWALEAGLLGPAVRLGLGAFLGVGLVAAAERLHRPPAATRRPDHVAAALAAGGLCALYGTSLSAHLLYAYLPAGLALALLALVAALALGLALRHGQALALLGTLGAWLAPLLVSTAEPRPWPLFLYLAGAALAGGLLVRLTAWRLLAGLLALLATGWPIGWLVAANGADSAVPLALYALLTAIAGLIALSGQEAGPAVRRTMRVPVIVMAVVVQVWAMAIGQHGPGVLLPAAVLSMAIAVFAARRTKERWLATAAAVANVLALLAWRLPLIDMPVSQLRDPAVALEPLLWLAPAGRPVAFAGAVVAAAWAGGGFWRATRGAAPGFWAGLSAAMPLAVLAVLHARLEGMAVSPGFAALAVALAALALGAVTLLRRRGGPEPAVAAYAIGVVGALALAFAIALREAWLVVALAALVPACGWVAGRLALPALARPALWIAAAILAGILRDLHAASWSAEQGPWTILYAHGLPLVAFLLARRLFGETAGEPLKAVLRGGALLLGLLLAAHELAWIAAATGARPAPLLDPALQVLAWVAGGVALLRWHQARPRRVLLWGWALLLAASAAQTLTVLLVERNPVLTGLPVGTLPILDLLLPVYGLVAVAALAVMVAAARTGKPLLARTAGGGALVLGLVWLTLEIRHAFRGSDLSGPTGEAEWLAHTAGWLAVAGLLLATGIRRGLRPVRQAALAVAGLAVLKAFVIDLAALEGLYRAASFLALGLCLVGLGWLHRRFVATPPASS